MISYVVASIVEGHGEVGALPLLIRRIQPTFVVARPIRVKRQRIENDVELRRYARIAEANIVQRGGDGAILLVLDADKSCAAHLGPKLESILREELPHRNVACALAVREYESWLVAGDPASQETSDEDRAGKHWLADRHARYSETVDQPRLTATLDLARAERLSRSFRHLTKVIRSFEQDVNPQASVESQPNGQDGGGEHTSDPK